jgi:phage-related protein
MPESQQHGCIWEDCIKKDIYQVSQRIPYTAKFDIPKELNTRNPDTNLSIKTTQAKSVDMGDALRVFENKEKTQLLVIQYKQEGTKKKLKEIVLCEMPPQLSLFGSVTKEELQKLVTMIKSVPKGKPTESLLDEIHSYKDELNKKSGCIHFRPKLDSMNQRRLQCSIVDFEVMLQSTVVVEKNTEGTLFNCSIPKELESCRRQRKTAQPDSEPE